MFTRTKVWGHRGCRGSSNPPENSFAAFQSAIEQGADGIELDLFLTRDGTLVVFHDETVERMTDGHGPITSFTLADLRKLRLKDPFGRGTDSTIPTLDEVLDLVTQFRNRHQRDERALAFVVNIEIKGAGIVEPLSHCLKERLLNGWAVHNFQVSSFDIEDLREMKRIRADISIGALFAGSENSLDIEERHLIDRLASIQDLRPATVNLTLPSLTPNAVRSIRNIGAAPLAWTSNEVHPDHLDAFGRGQLASRLLSSGIAAIITDYPGPMRKLLGANI